MAINVRGASKLLLAISTMGPGLVAAQEGAASAIHEGHTAWMITASALVLLMTMPGLALFYGGLVRSKNVVSTLMHCFAICCLASILWLVVAYSLAFGGEGGSVMQLSGWVGGLERAFLLGVGTDTLTGQIPETVFFTFQMTFAIITPALIVGAYIERIKFGAVVAFTALWLILVYAPIAHWIWGGGWLSQLGIQDFAGGLVVHLACGVGAVIIAFLLGPRKGFPNEIHPPHSPGMTMAGAALLWVGWFGFNGGSALSADGSAGMAIIVTHIAAATAAFTWMCIEWARYRKPTLIGIATGTIAGLATITPASGYVGPLGGLVIGLVGGGLCYLAIFFVKGGMGIDDALDVLAVHGFGGAAGILLTAIFGASRFGGLGLSQKSILEQLFVQLVGIVAVLIWTAILTYLIVQLIGRGIGLRVSDEEEIEGLDVSTHGERGYDL